jgi:hypothetical protein
MEKQKQWEAAHRMSEPQVSSLESAVAKNPEDLESRKKLMSFGHSLPRGLPKAQKGHHARLVPVSDLKVDAASRRVPYFLRVERGEMRRLFLRNPQSSRWHLHAGKFHGQSRVLAVNRGVSA